MAPKLNNYQIHAFITLTNVYHDPFHQILKPHMVPDRFFICWYSFFEVHLVSAHTNTCC